MVLDTSKRTSLVGREEGGKVNYSARRTQLGSSKKNSVDFENIEV